MEGQLAGRDSCLAMVSAIRRSASVGLSRWATIQPTT